MNARHLLAPLLSASLALPAVMLTPTQAEAADLLAMRAKTANAAASVLGLRSDDPKAGEALTASLRAAFAERDMSGGEEMPLEDVILTLGCSSETDTACMTEAGRALSVEQLVYGDLKKAGDDYILDISVLDVASGNIEAQATMPLSGDSLSAGNVDATGTEVVNSLYPTDDGATAVPPPVVADAGDPDEAGTDEGVAEDGAYVWGPYKPRPTWKKVGLGISLAVLVTSAVASTYGWVSVNKGRYRERIIDSYTPDPNKTAEENLAEETEVRASSKDGGDPVGYCKRMVSGVEDANGDIIVRDEASAEACQTWLGVRTMHLATLGVGIAAGVSTVAFTVLMFVHKKDPPGSSARRRSFRLTGGPTRGGAMLGGVGRF